MCLELNPAAGMHELPLPDDGRDEGASSIIMVNILELSVTLAAKPKAKACRICTHYQGLLILSSIMSRDHHWVPLRSTRRTRRGRPASDPFRRRYMQPAVPNPGKIDCVDRNIFIGSTFILVLSSLKVSIH